MLYDLMRSRRSVRRFTPESPPRQALVKLLEAAITAPSASNKQPWRFLVIETEERILAMAAAVRQAKERIARSLPESSVASFLAYGDYFTRFEEAPVVIVPIWRRMSILSNLVGPGLAQGDRSAIDSMEETSGLVGASLALQNMLLMAHQEGLGASAMTGPLVATAALRDLLEIPGSWGIVAVVAVGYPAEAPTPTDRKSLDNVVRYL